jgi:hypothetical protein
VGTSFVLRISCARIRPEENTTRIKAQNLFISQRLLVKHFTIF